MNDNIKTSNKNLFDIATSIMEVPERIDRIDIIRLKELLLLLVHDRKEKSKFIYQMIEANPNYPYPSEYEPNKLFNYWAERYSQGPLGNYFKINQLEQFVIQQIQSLENSINNGNLDSEYSYPKIFRKNGFNLFKFIDKKYDEKKIKKYNFVYHYLNSHSNEDYTIKCDAASFKTFLNNNYLQDSTVSRISGYASDQFQIYVDEYENTIMNYLHELKREFITRLNKNENILK